jgi:hemerythrin
MDLVWDSRYDTGIELIDAQHHELLEAVNRLRRAVAESSARVDIEGQVRDLVRLSAVHCATEEKFMVETGYPGFTQQGSAHAEMLASLYQLEERVQGGHESFAMTITTFLEGWLKHHISEGDIGFATYLDDQDQPQGKVQIP